MFDVSVVLTAHREGVIAGATIRSALQAIEYAERTCNIRIELVAVLDKADDMTSFVITNGLGERAKIIHANEGDPGQTRNRGVENASGSYVTFLDGDDLWSYNWIEQAWKRAVERPEAVFHSECNITFGNERNVWWHIDSEGPLFDKDYLDWGNYWDSLSFARRDIYARFPFRNNDLKGGFGHEDWHWNYVTLVAGLPHKPVPGTIHFKRRRRGSQMSLVEQSGSVIWPVDRGSSYAAPVHLAVALPFSGAEPSLDALCRIFDLRFLRGPAPACWSMPAIWLDTQFAGMSTDEITELKSTLPHGANVLLFVRNPYERARDEIEDRVFVRGGARGPISDTMLDVAMKSLPCLSQSMAEMVANWTSVFGDRARMVCIDELKAPEANALHSLGDFLGVPVSSSLDFRWDEIYSEPLRPSLTSQQRATVATSVYDDIVRLEEIIPKWAYQWKDSIRDVIECNADAQAEEAGDVAFRTLLRWTESVGDNCEFGFVQRYEAYEPSSLFRWAVTPVDKLVAYLKEPMPLFLRNGLATTSSDLVLDTASGFYFHSDLTVQDGEGRRFLTDEEGFVEIYDKEVKKIEYFVKKFFMNLTSNPGIYIYKRNNSLSDEEFMNLAQLIKRFNSDHIVLCVRADAEFKLERMGDGIYAGTIRKFAEYHTANIVDQDSWKALLMSLYENPEVKDMVNKAFC